MCGDPEVAGHCVKSFGRVRGCEYDVRVVVVNTMYIYIGAGTRRTEERTVVDVVTVDWCCE